MNVHCWNSGVRVPFSGSKNVCFFNPNIKTIIFISVSTHEYASCSPLPHEQSINKNEYNTSLLMSSKSDWVLGKIKGKCICWKMIKEESKISHTW